MHADTIPKSTCYIFVDQIYTDNPFLPLRSLEPLMRRNNLPACQEINATQ